MDYTQRPGDHECFDFHRDYVGLVPDGSILDLLTQQARTEPEFIRNLPVAEFETVHPPYGWPIRTVLEHCCDAERVFGYRALRFATGDKTDLPGWDENHYAACHYGNAHSPVDLAEEFSSLREANLRLVKRLEPAAWDQLGTADGRGMSVRTIAWLMAGHWLHHKAILVQRLGLTS